MGKPRKKTQHWGTGYYSRATKLDWESAAAVLPGKALHVARALWSACSFAKSCKVELPTRNLNAWGLGRGTVTRALGHMEKAGLARVLKNRKPGKRRWVEVSVPVRWFKQGPPPPKKGKKARKAQQSGPGGDIRISWSES